jgi:hypothetical protein
MRRRSLLALVLAAACSAALLLGLEAWLRLAGFQAQERHAPDPVLGWTLRPAPGVNAAGARDRPYLLHKAHDVYRIAVLGDEYSEARELPVRSTYWRLLGERLERCGFQPGKEVEVLNFAVAGYGTAQQYVMLESRAMRYRPDLVLLQFAADDVRENSFALAARKDRPFFMLEPSGGVRIDESFSTSPGFRRQTALGAQVLRRAVDRSRLLQLVSRAEAAPGASPPPPQGLWDEAWRITEALIVKAAEFSARNGARFLLLSIPAERRLAELAGRSGIPAVQLAPAAAHATAADVLAKVLCP